MKLGAGASAGVRAAAKLAANTAACAAAVVAAAAAVSDSPRLRLPWQPGSGADRAAHFISKSSGGGGGSGSLLVARSECTVRASRERVSH